MIRWLIQTTVNHPDLSAGRPPAELLTAAELGQVHGYLSPRRRRDWLLGRWTAKRLVQMHIAAKDCFCPALNSFTIEYEPSGAPYIASQYPALRGAPNEGRIPLALSISHNNGYAFCALAANETGQVRIGADIELVEPRPDGFTQEFFTCAEQARINSAPSVLSAMLTTATWSAKESVLKAAHLGLSADPRSVECLLHPTLPRSWTRLNVEMQPAIQTRSGAVGPIAAWWRVIDNRLRPNTSFILSVASYGIRI
jgi:4'-phosphopantetheinyl transferase